MAPVGQRKQQTEFSHMSNGEISQRLKAYGLTVGPINSSTRWTYERQLIKLQTGAFPPSDIQYEPVDDDDNYENEDDEWTGTRPVQNISTSPQVYMRPHRDSEYLLHNDQPFSQRYQPTVSSNKPPTYMYDPPARQSNATRVSGDSSHSIPLWIKLVVLVIVLILVYCIYINLEPQVVSNIPELS